MNINPLPPCYKLTLPSSDFVEKREIASQIASLLVKSIPPPIGKPDNNVDWTRSVRRELGTLLSGSEFLEKNWLCFPTDPNTPKGEFLVDLVWWRAREGAALVVESEWLPKLHAILTDFDKICVIKSPFKLMIYNTVPTGPTSAEVKEKFQEHLSEYKQHIEGVTYIFLEFMPNERAQAFIWQAKLSEATQPAVLEMLLPVTQVIRRLA